MRHHTPRKPSHTVQHQPPFIQPQFLAFLSQSLVHHSHVLSADTLSRTYAHLGSSKSTVVSSSSPDPVRWARNSRIPYSRHGTSFIHNYPVGAHTRNRRKHPYLHMSSSSESNEHSVTEKGKKKHESTASADHDPMFHPAENSTLPPSAVLLTLPESKQTVCIIGCLHGSADSANDIVQIFDHFGPRIHSVVLELCEKRIVSVLRDVESEDNENNGTRSESTSVTNTPKSRSKSPSLFHLFLKDGGRDFGGRGPAIVGFILTLFYVVQKKLGGDPGIEFKAAIRKAKAINADLIMGDQMVADTLSNIFNSFNAFNMFKSFSRDLDFLKKTLLPTSGGVSVMRLIFQPSRFSELARLIIPVAVLTNLSIITSIISAPSTSTSDPLTTITAAAVADPSLTSKTSSSVTATATAAAIKSPFNDLSSSLTSLASSYFSSVEAPASSMASALASASTATSSSLMSNFDFSSGWDPSIWISKDFIFDSVANVLVIFFLFWNIRFLNVLINDRDVVLEQSIRKACKRPKDLDEGKDTVIVVVGLLHVNGIVRRLCG